MSQITYFWKWLERENYSVHRKHSFSEPSVAALSIIDIMI